jgi:membrane protein DedA with SNARE-associated domain
VTAITPGHRLSERTVLTLYLVPVLVLFSAGLVVAALLPTLVANAPYLVPVMSTQPHRILLVQPLIPAGWFFGIALTRQLLGDTLFYLFGRRYGDVGIQWIERRLGPDSKFTHNMERFFRRAAYFMIAIVPSNILCALAGAARMRASTFFLLNYVGTVVRVTLIFYLGDALAAPLGDVNEFIAKYQWDLTPVTIALVLLSVVRRRRKGRLPLETVDEVEAELEATELQLESEATIHDNV